jgi:phosphatidylinositol alpha-mannosyltransferase
MSRVWRKVALGLAVSKAAADCIESRTAARVRVIPNGIDTTTFSEVPANGKPAARRVLFVGRLDKRKGFPVVVRAFAMLAGRFPDLALVVVGDGPDRACVERLPPEIRARVVMRGTCRDAELVSDYASAAVFLAPALGCESFGVVLLEAMSAGLPVVASDIQGYREVARDSAEAILVPPGDAAALAEAAGRILSDPDLAHSLGERGRSRARQFAWEAVAASVEAVYEEGLGLRWREE